MVTTQQPEQLENRSDSLDRKITGWMAKYGIVLLRIGLVLQLYVCLTGQAVSIMT